jgi:hypothetical protein
VEYVALLEVAAADMNADWLADSAEEVEYVALREAAA